MHEKDIQEQIQHHAIEQEIYLTQHAQQNWFLLGDKNQNIFN